MLKFCARQLGPMFAQPVKVLLNLHVVPRSWKTSTISLVPKKKKYWSSGNRLGASVANRLDLLQFAYRARGGGGVLTMQR